ncbi:uncharacterized protein EKO05_0008655 [Ascochyta rabiei]|uniref:Uncharacterized protein n=1 Tax=Didymella rabiei TaxID=5454 RepID=A0A163FUS2_DIDRA|nr:uncharacterized protein EKO05_0008655 [Ascochyta rabiei]KZM24545.1 hypothetical protein ST47_g4271 [Ascochyta rabiei]UPX18353.1 hypothetical protein EKO05_0008655 [Ascochyta rabiei]
MALGWLMLVHWEPPGIETMVDDGLCQLQVHIDRFVSISGMTTQWKHRVLHQPASVFVIVIGVSILWIVLSHLSSWRHQHVVQAPATQESSSLTSLESSSPPPRANNKNTSPTSNDIVRIVLTTAVHRPAGPSLNVSYLRNGNHTVVRTSCVSNPESQTPLVANLSKQNFLALAETAPVSYDTLQRNGILNRDGTLTKKYSPGLGKGKKLALDDKEAVGSYDSPTATSGRPKQSPRTTKEVHCQAEYVKALWVDDPDDELVQHLSPAKGKW